MTPKLQAQALTKSFRAGGRGRAEPAVAGVDVAVVGGEFVSIVGPSGCGKTTFLRVVGGLLPPTSGVVRLDGQAVTGPGPDRGFVFQKASLWPWRTVVKNVTFGLEVQGVSAAAARRRARDVLRMVGLTGYEDHYPHQLSGGMQQRVNLARALVLDPEILLMDEPFAALDAQTREVMQEELLRIWSENRRTVLLVTHHIEEAVYLSDRVVVFSARPARVAHDVRIEIARPRSPRVRLDPAFRRYVDDIWENVRREVETAAPFAPGATSAGGRH